MNTNNFLKRTLVRTTICVAVALGLIVLGKRLSSLPNQSNDFTAQDILSEVIISESSSDRKFNLQPTTTSTKDIINPAIERQEKRKDALYRYCQHAKSITGKVNYGEGFLYNDKHKVVYCRVPKVGCSTWKRVLLIFEGAQKTLFEKHVKDIHNYPYKYLDNLKVAKIEERKNFFYSFMFSRHPFDRLFSAYRNKFLDPKGRYGYLESLGPAMVYPHIKTAKEMDAHLAKHHNGNRRLNVTFTHFVKFILAEPPGTHDTHWQPQTDICKVCNFKFDHIGKFETMYEDAKVIFDSLKHPEIFEQFGDDSVYTQKTTTMLKEYYDELPKELLPKIYNFYKNDFDAFEYDPSFYFTTLSDSKN